MTAVGRATVGLPRVFDGHNDTLLRLHLAGGAVTPFLAGRRGHLDLPKARAGGFGGGFFAVFVPTPAESELMALTGAAAGEGRRKKASKREAWSRDNAPYPDPVPHQIAAKVASEVVNLAHRLVAESSGQVAWLTDPGDLEALRPDFAAAAELSEQVPLRMVLHFEGAEPIAEDLSDLETWYQRGLRSLGLVWSRRNRFAAGVPFRFPSTPDHFEGLSSAGFELVRACNQMGILLDLAHLNEKGFWDVHKTTAKPLVVTHSGALRISPSSRNLTDDQIRAVGDSGGVVGINLHCGDVRADGRLNNDTPLSDVVRHIEVVSELAGIGHVALGSDFDGALMPQCLADASALPVLLQHLLDDGWSRDEVAEFAYGNWFRALKTAWSG